MLFAVLARKMYARNVQYRGSHMVHNIASAAFGFIYVSIWAGLADNRLTGSASLGTTAQTVTEAAAGAVAAVSGEDSASAGGLGLYGLQGMVAYIAFNQASLWIALFLNNGLGMEQSVRTGQIALDLMRPVHLFYHLMSKEWGQIAYQFVYKFLPIYLLYFFVFSLQVPHRAMTYLWVAFALLLAAYISICMNYLIGVTALWTTESRWLYWVNHALSMLLSGFFIPLEWLPGWLHAVSVCSPYPFLQYHPTRMYLEMEGPGALWGALAWGAALTLVCLLATRAMRHKVEVQGG